MALITNPLLLDIPDYFETERLLIRAPHTGDGTLKTLDETEMMLRRMATRFLLREDFAQLLFRKADPQFVGSSGLHQVNWEVPNPRQSRALARQAAPG